ncbi:MAG: hypothetical protein K2N34_07380, partial [Lachnospiraceae bacterium]|nr:hypothetical protein [Lachnospiraceae bacterium]
FSDVVKSIYLEVKSEKYVRKELRPAGIMIGAIPSQCGNTLVRQSLAGHPQVMMIEEYGSHFNSNLYSICIRLAEEQAGDIVSTFRMLYLREASDVDENAASIGFDKEKFYHKIEELLSEGGHFTSSELFIVFHLAYEAGFGREYMNLSSVIIYWEPHQWDRQIVKEWAYWLGSMDIKCFVLKMVRNRYIYAGSYMRNSKGKNGFWAVQGSDFTWQEKRGGAFDERVVTFEDLKCRPREMLSDLCEWLGIAFDDVLLDTTYHGVRSFYDGTITGFDVKPVYNLSEEYFSAFDRIRICLIQGIYQKQYGYPYVSCLEFTRRELQEMFLKSFRWEKIPKIAEKMTENRIRYMHACAAKLLWKGRFAEIMKVNEDQDLEMVYLQ